jgi:hypothetical protein
MTTPIQESHSLKANNSSASRKILRILRNKKFHYLFSQQPAISSYPEPDQSSQLFPNTFL